jgi:hypothetical protein
MGYADNVVRHTGVELKWRCFVTTYRYTEVTTNLRRLTDMAELERQLYANVPTEQISSHANILLK